MKRFASVIPLLLAACTGNGASTRPVEPWYGAPVDNHSNFAERLLREHNKERIRLGLVPLRWSSNLAAHARGYADKLAATGKLAHSAPSARPGEGENLWKGTAGAYSLEEMMGHFLAEAAQFRRGTFPQVTNGAPWEDVAHYTQIIWPATTEVGCAIVTRRGSDFLVCRYAPQGNVVGQQVP